MKALVFSTILLTWTISVFAQWSNDPTVNTLVADFNNQNTVAKIAADNKGNYFISNWTETDDPESHFALWLQKVDANGMKMWGDSGILVSRHKSSTWLSDYSLIADTAGNAFIFFEDLRAHDGISHVYGYSISPSGDMRWGTDGIRVDDDNYFNAYSPHSMMTYEGNIVVAWDILHGSSSSHGMGIRAMKLSPSGAWLWSSNQVFLGSDSIYMMPNLLPVENDDFMMIWTKYVTVTHGVGEMYYKYIYAQRYDESGLPVWAQNAVVCDLDTLAYILPDFPDWAIKPDTSGGAFIGWNDGRSMTDFNNIYIQHVDKNGDLKWEKNGIPVSPVNYGSDREYPYICYLPASDELAVFWSELKQLPQGWFFELTGQKFNSGGAILWSDTGKVFCQSGGDTIYTIINTLNGSGSDAVVFFQKKLVKIIGTDTTISIENYAMRIDTEGKLMWDPVQPMLSGAVSEKYGQVVASEGDQFVIVWQDNRNSPPAIPYGGIYAQNISINGKLGPLGIKPLAAGSQSGWIFPNPSTGHSMLHFEKSLTGNVQVEIFSSDGRSVLRCPIFSAQGKKSFAIDGSALSPGVYLVRITSGQTLTDIRWIIVH